MVILSLSATIFTHALALVSISDNSLPATAFKDMKAPFAPGEPEENQTDKGLRVADKGFLNTAVIRSEITYIDGDTGGDHNGIIISLVLIPSSSKSLDIGILCCSSLQLY